MWILSFVILILVIVIQFWLLNRAKGLYSEMVNIAWETLIDNARLLEMQKETVDRNIKLTEDNIALVNILTDAENKADEIIDFLKNRDKVDKIN